MTTSLAKISRPRLFGVVPRQRLFDLLEANQARSLLWLCAPPGAGKTTLLASYIEAHLMPSVWYQLDAGDADPAAFFPYLSQAAQAHHSRDELQLPPFVAEHLADLKSFARHFFRAFFAQMPGGLILVLDNYQDVPENAFLHDTVHQCIAEVPPQHRVIVASRAEPPRQFSQWAANGAMLSVGWDQLRMTVDEVREICSRRGIADEWLIQALHRRAGGWAAGLTLMLERLGHVDGHSRELPNDTREAVFNYFASLIFDQSPRGTQELLPALALVPYVTPSLAADLSGQDGAAALLESFYRRHLFTDRRAGVEPVYQFHGLFRDFLQDQARQRFSVAAYDALIVRSAYAMENMRETDVAMELWISAGYWDQAIRLVLREANALLASGRAQTLTHWALTIPESQRAKEPWLLYWLGCAQHQTAPDIGLSTLDAALVEFRDGTDRRGHLLCLATLLSKAFVGYAAVVAMNRWLDELLELLQTPVSFASAEDELRVRGVLSFALFYVRPWHPETAQSLQRVEELLLECTDARVKLSTAAGAVAQCAWSGDIERGERILAAVESGMDFDSASPSEAAWCLTWFGYLRFIQARYEDALAYIGRACAIVERSGLRVALRETLYQRFMVEFRARGWPVANVTLDEMEAMPASQRPLTQSLLYYYQARRATHKGRQSEAARLAILSHRSVLRTGSVFQEMFFSLMSADILLDDGRIEESRPLLARSRALIEQAEVFDCFRSALLFAEAWFAMQQSLRENALRILQQSLHLAREGHRRYYLRFLECALPKLLAIALSAGVEAGAVQDIIRMFRLAPPEDAPDNWPWPLRIVTLGRFEVSVNDAPVAFSRKLPRKVLLLLKAIIAFGGTDVPEEALCDALWSDEEGDAAVHALGITVARLRKLLGTNDAIVVRGGKISLNGALCWVDLAAFESRLEARREIAALELYGGNFLPEDTDRPWTIALRERMRGKFIHALSSHGIALESGGDPEGALKCYLRGIDADPIVEYFHQGLMRCYDRLGRRTEAISVYRRMRQTLSVLLGVPPSEESQRLYEKLLCDQREGGDASSLSGVEEVVHLPPLRKAT